MGAPNRTTSDGRYNYRRWDEPPPVWSYLGPFASNAERLVQQALSPMFMTGQEIRENVSTPLPQIQRPRFGYTEYQERQPTVQDVVGTDRGIPSVSWYSGGPAGYSGSSRFSSNSLGRV